MNPEYMRVILHVFFRQKDKDTTISEITRLIFKNIKTDNITRTAEYTHTLRILKTLENKKVIKKIKPVKKDKFKTHYVIDLPNFTSLILDFLKELPLYGQDKNRDLGKKTMKSNELIQKFITIFYVGLSQRFLFYLFSDLNQFRDLASNLTLAESIFLFINKTHSNVMPDIRYTKNIDDSKEDLAKEGNVGEENIDFELLSEEEENRLPNIDLKKSLEEAEKESINYADTLSYYSVQYEKYIKKEKNQVKKNFFRFLLILKVIEHKYLPYSYSRGLAYDLWEFKEIALFNRKTWNERQIRPIVEGKKSPTEYFFHD